MFVRTYLKMVKTTYEAQKQVVENTIDPQWEQRREAYGLRKELFDPSKIKGESLDLRDKVESAGETV
jgi:hypothetical protein